MNPSEIIYKSITDKIMNKEWLPGMKISSENQLSNEFSVSRMSVREAIEKLVALNVLTKKQGEGTFVNELTPSIYLNQLIPMIMLEEDNIIDILEFRKIIEIESASLCAQKCNEEIVQELEKYYEDMYMNNTEKPEVFPYADFKFHMTIAKGTGNSLLLKVNTILTDLLKFHQQVLNQSLGADDGVNGHRKILDAIKARDSELAAIFMRRHIDSAISRLKDSYR